MQSMIDRLTAALPENALQLNSPVKAVVRQDRKWIVQLEDDRAVVADGVVLATAARITAKILESVDADLAADLSKIENASSVVVNLLFKRSDIASKLDGFGFVVPKTEAKNILACAYISVKFPKRCPDRFAMLRVFLGGERARSQDDFPAIALSELKSYLKINGSPIKTWVTRWPESMPQYTVGHKDLVASIQSRVSPLSGLVLAGNSYDGVGIPDCIRSGKAAAKKVVDSVR
jgi:oxygen-dependent protoporphyrinogen oxidase